MWVGGALSETQIQYSSEPLERKTANILFESARTPVLSGKSLRHHSLITISQGATQCRTACEVNAGTTDQLVSSPIQVQFPPRVATVRQSNAEYSPL
jgi:hypothetical protein